MEAQAKDVVKIQNRKVNAILVGLLVLSITFVVLAFQPIKYAEVATPSATQIEETIHPCYYIELVSLKK